jgi:hypothetical protein
VNSDPSPDELEDHENLKSINDGPERLRPLLPSLRSISVPKFGVNIPSTVDTSAFSTFIADAAKLSSFEELSIPVDRRVSGDLRSGLLIAV